MMARCTAAKVIGAVGVCLMLLRSAAPDTHHLWLVLRTAASGTVLTDAATPSRTTVSRHSREGMPRCSWDGMAWLPDERGTVAADHLMAFARFLDTASVRMGIDYSLTDGSLLGAVRHAGLIPGDRDFDALLIVPSSTLNLTKVSATLEEHLHSLGNPFRLELMDDGRHRWLQCIPWLQNMDDGHPLHADVRRY